MRRPGAPGPESREGSRRKTKRGAAVGGACMAALLLAQAMHVAIAREPPRGEARRPAIDAEFDAAFARFELPGLAVGVVEDGEITYMRAAGELRAGGGEPVTPRTLFKIASNSKAMTTALLARLVDQDKLGWDDPVVKHLPDFRMHDPWVTREIQVRDLLIHNSGLGAGAGDLMLWPEPNLFTREDVVAGMAHLKPIHSFRSRYAYDNTLYIVAGEVAAAAAGAESYEALLRNEVFEPLGLERCRVGEWRRDEAGEVAQPHIRIDGRNVPVREDGDVVAAVPMAAAGGIRCSLDDMLRWIAMWLQPERFGLVDDEPWLSREQRQALWTAHTPMPLGRRLREWDGARFHAYGYGWRLNDADGLLKVSHTGTLSGMYSAVTLLPELGVGFVVLMNGGGSDARSALVQALSKRFTAPEAVDRTVAYYADAIAAEAAANAGDTGASAPDTSSRRVAGTDAMAPWLGVYRDPWFGEASVCRRGDVVRFAAAKSPMLTGTVMRVGERLLVDWDEVSVDAEAWLAFAEADDAGAPPTLAMAKVDPQADFSYDYQDLAFVRVDDCP